MSTNHGPKQFRQPRGGTGSKPVSEDGEVFPKPGGRWVANRLVLAAHMPRCLLTWGPVIASDVRRQESPGAALVRVAQIGDALQWEIDREKHTVSRDVCHIRHVGQSGKGAAEFPERCVRIEGNVDRAEFAGRVEAVARTQAPEQGVVEVPREVDLCVGAVPRRGLAVGDTNVAAKSLGAGLFLSARRHAGVRSAGRRSATRAAPSPAPTSRPAACRAASAHRTTEDAPPTASAGPP